MRQSIDYNLKMQSKERTCVQNNWRHYNEAFRATTSKEGSVTPTQYVYVHMCDYADV